MSHKVIKIKVFEGISLKEIQQDVDNFKCPGDYIDFKLWKFRDLYQAALIYTKPIVCKICGAGENEPCDAGLHS